MRRNLYLAAGLAVAVLTAGCAQFETSRETLSPSAPSPIPGGSSTGPLVGTWAPSQGITAPDPSTCTNFQWEITSQSDTEVQGRFSAECAGGISISATVSGILQNPTTVAISISGTGVVGGLGCPFTLNGVGNIFDDNHAIRIPYTGTTCFGPVQGAETLRRPRPASPDPPSEPEPESGDPLFGCGGIPEKYKLVECIHEHIRPVNVEQAFEVTKRVAWALRDEGAGLLIKNGGENIVHWQGMWFAAGRIVYRDLHLYKVLADVGDGGANAPSWQDEGVDPGLAGRWVSPIDPNQP